MAIKLEKVVIRNFRSLKHVKLMFQRDITLLVGENDVGKSSVLDIVEWALSVPKFGKEPTGKKSIFSVLDINHNAEVQEVEITLSLLENATITDIKYLLTPVEETENAPLKYEVSLRKNGESDFKSVDRVTKLKDLVPYVQRYRALEYKNPESFFEKTFKNVLKKYLVAGDASSKLSEVEASAKKELNKIVQKYKEFATQYLSSGDVGLEYAPNFDFPAAFKGGELWLIKNGIKLPLSRLGDGTKRKLFMAALEWEARVSSDLESDVSFLKLYDEPDANLHYNAQREFFKAIYQLVSANSGEQVVISTHSLVMIDNARARMIIHLVPEAGPSVYVETLRAEDDHEIESFLDSVARQLGLKNSSLLFDKCLLMVEGETEEKALPLLYEKLYGTYMAEDGIAIVGLGGVKSPAPVYKALKRRAHSVLYLIDEDLYEAKKKQLLNQEWTEEAVNKALVPIGEGEFEELFSDEFWARLANHEWPRQDREWTAADFAALRGSKKFSKKLVETLQKGAKIKGGLGKPTIGTALAMFISKDEIPETIEIIFGDIRKRIGIV